MTLVMRRPTAINLAASDCWRAAGVQGDWGTQFGMLITNMQESGGLDRVGDNSISDLLQLYRCPPSPPFSVVPGLERAAKSTGL